MSMQEPTDDQLDGLFRKSAEEFNTPFDPAAWQVLRTRLDTHDRLTVWEHLLRWGLPALLLLMLVGGSWNAYRQHTVVNHLPSSVAARRQPASATVDPVAGDPTKHRQQRTDKDQPLPTPTAASLAKVDDPEKPIIAQSDESNQPVATADADEPLVRADEVVTTLPVASGKRNRPATTGVTSRAIRPNKPTTVAKPVYGAEPAARSSSTAGPVSTVKRPERARSGMGQRRQSRRLSEGIAKNRVATTFPVPNDATTRKRSFSKRRVTPDATAERVTNGDSFDRFDKSFLSESADAELVVSPSFSELTGRPGQWPKPLPFKGREVTAPISPTPVKPPLSVQPVPLQKGLSVRFVVSPDLSSIGLRNFRRPGTNVGLLLEYRLASRWSVQAGAIRSTKVYKALSTQYELDSYLAKLKVPPESVNGRCNILDIPINLRYDVALRPRSNGQVPSRWFVSGGVTAYIMQREDYVYNYPAGTHIYSSTPTEWSVNTGRYNLSQLNLSAGYERALSRRLSWQVEPFVKAPLKGVGYYKINLLSTGAFFSLRYKL